MCHTRSLWPWGRVLLVAALWLATGGNVGAQVRAVQESAESPTRPTTSPEVSTQVLVCGDEEGLWVVVANLTSTRVFLRAVGSGSFVEQPGLSAQVTRSAAVNGALFAKLEGRQNWVLLGGRWLRQRDLPAGVFLLDWHGGTGTLFAMVRSVEPGAFSRSENDVAGSAKDSAEPGSPPLALMRYMPTGWILVATAPSAIDSDADQPVRLGALHDQLAVFWYDARRSTIRHAQYVFADDRWDEGPETPPVEGLVDFWVAELEGVPALLISKPRATGSAALSGFRLLAEGDAWQWRAVEPRHTPLPAGGEVVRFLDVQPYRDEAVALVQEAEGEVYLCHVRRETAPTEPALRIADVVRGQDRADRRLYLFQYLMLGLMTAIVISLFALRRSAMVTPAALPAGTMLAPVFQRLTAFLIDIVPLALLMGALLRVGPQEGFRRLLEWTLAGDASEGRLPDLATLLWWELTCFVYMLYAMLMELFVGRTFGKMLFGIRLWGEAGQAAKPGQIVVRNAFRLIELIPPLWLLAFVVVVSRNRQRVGDMFARTVVIRSDPNVRSPEPQKSQEPDDPV
ncbi:MAG: RDD family protein [Phycisphaerales bacterium]|nr:RDD family protein [Phycisphaerales bacterium]